MFQLVLYFCCFLFAGAVFGYFERIMRSVSHRPANCEEIVKNRNGFGVIFAGIVAMWIILWSRHMNSTLAVVIMVAFIVVAAIESIVISRRFLPKETVKYG